MSKDSLLKVSSHKKSKFPTRISSKVPIKLSQHSRNNSYEGQNSNKFEKDNNVSIVKTEAVNSNNQREESQCSTSYYSFFSSEKEPLNASNASLEYNESVTMAVLNFDCYSKLNNSSKGSSDFDSDNLNNILNNDKSYTIEPNFNKTKEEKAIFSNYNEMNFNPDESTINFLEKPSFNIIDTSKSILFSNSTSYIDNNRYSYSEKKQASLKNSRNNSLGRKPSKNEYDDYPLYDDIRSSSLPRKNIDSPLNNKIQSINLPNPNNSCTYSIKNIEPAYPIEYEIKNNYKLYNDDNDSFIYNQSELLPNYIKVKSNDISDSGEERRYRSLSRKHHKYYRSPSKNSDKESQGKSRSRSRSKSKSKLERQNSQSESRYRSLSRNRKNSKDEENRIHSLSRSRKNSKDDESRYRSLSRNRKDSKDDESRYRSLSRNRKDSKDDENRYRSLSRSRKSSKDDERVEKLERKRSTSRHKKCHRRNKSSSNHSSPLVKSSPIIRNNHGSPLTRGSSLVRKNSNDSNNGSLLIRNNSHGSNKGSPLVRKESYRSPLSSNNVINNKFSTDFIHNDYNITPYDNKKCQNVENSYKTNNNYDEDYRNNKSSVKTIGETQDLDIINEICDLKKFSQDFSNLNILESILNKPIEDDFEFLNYNRIPEKKFDNQKFSTLSRLQTKHNKSSELTRRNSLNELNKGHNRTKSEQIRNENNNHKGSKRNFFNFFSHKKSKSYSNTSNKEESDFDKMIKGNETIKIKLQPTNKLGLSYIERSIDDYKNNTYYDSGNHNEEYNSNHKNFIKDTKMNQPMNFKNYIPLFKVSMINKNKNHHYDNMEFYGAQSEMATNPYDQFKSFSTDGGERNFVNIGNRNSSLNRNNKHGGKRIIY